MMQVKLPKPRKSDEYYSLSIIIKGRLDSGLIDHWQAVEYICIQCGYLGNIIKRLRIFASRPATCAFVLLYALLNLTPERHAMLCIVCYKNAAVQDRNDIPHNFDAC